MGLMRRTEATRAVEHALRQWMHIAYLFAARKEGRFKVQPEEYKILHHELVVKVGEAAAAADPQKRPALEEMHDELLPWVSLDALAKSERDILFGVLDECETVRRLLRGRLRVSRRWLYITIPLTVVGFVVGLVVIMGQPLGPNFFGDLGLSLRRWIRSGFTLIVGSSRQQKIIVGGGLAAVITAVVVWFSARKV
jgi:hypothetical protein